ncbi:MAG: prolyl oligopeptidase family serine peptidase [bacterium]
MEEPSNEAPLANAPQPETVYYESDGLKLKAYLYKPQGNGPFPAYLWNHGSEKNPNNGQKIAKFWLDHGFVLFAPIRSGHGDNPGDYIGDLQKALRQNGLNRRENAGQTVKLHERANDDVVAAYKWLKGQSFVDPKRIVVAGGSYGGIQTVLTSERDAREKLGVRAFIPMSPAAMSWKNPVWAVRLSQAVRNSKAPIFLMQAQNDYNLGPSEVLGPLVDAKGFPSRHKIFPIHVLPGGDPNDHRQGHGKFFGDPSAWQADVLQYLKDCGVIR